MAKKIVTRKCLDCNNQINIPNRRCKTCKREYEKVPHCIECGVSVSTYGTFCPNCAQLEQQRREAIRHSIGLSRNAQKKLCSNCTFFDGYKNQCNRYGINVIKTSSCKSFKRYKDAIKVYNGGLCMPK